MNRHFIGKLIDWFRDNKMQWKAVYWTTGYNRFYIIKTIGYKPLEISKKIQNKISGYFLR